jgi:pilus assembly protein CpaB
VALTSITVNEPILKWKISGAGSRASLSAVVKEGMRAVSVRVNDVIGVGGFLLPGDRVDVLFTKKGEREIPGSTDILIQNARVLAVDQIADQKKDEPVVAKVATLEVTTFDAQKIALAQQVGSLSLMLRAAGSLDPAPAQRVVEQELVSSPSVYESEFNARKSAEQAINARLAQLEGSITGLSKDVEGSISDLAKEIQTSLDDLAKSYEGSLSELAKKVQESDKSKSELDVKLADIEKKLRGEILNAGKSSENLRNKLGALELALQQTAKATGQGEATLRAKLTALEKAMREAVAATGEGEEALRSRLADIEKKLRGEIATVSKRSSDDLRKKLVALEEAVKQTAKATGQGDATLRAKLAALETAIRQASAATGVGEEALRAKLAEFEANLKRLAATPPQVVVQQAEPEPEIVAMEPVKTTATVGVTRGIKRESYEVPLDISAR